MTPVTALVLAGTRSQGDPLTAYAGVSHKALIDVGGQTMLERVVTALAKAPEVARILVAIEQPQLIDGLEALHAPACSVPVEAVAATPGPGPSASVAAALEQVGTPLLVATADHPLMQTEWITDFLTRTPEGCDVAALLAPRRAVLAALPQTQRTYLHFADGQWSGCNLFFMATPKALAAVRLWREVEAQRKHPLRIIRRLGPSFAMRYVARRLTLEQALERLQALCGARGAVVESPCGLAAVDVDKPADLDLVRQLIAARSTSCGTPDPTTAN